ncbi:hypothetical protein COW36_22205 [bacterium (Candidatus Blackallbacteria) CG17_big_fil_post_rev_8_21_14_2_50_48_46]|uniref:EF-hand domain-containing protein n=1 Tax=bacterium (Candidatus Blackallbacteria) CG17_big_fil_post_rev_8_21_14_2_50_48_46 TaxID=2014261 RepID=A0A2M7FYB3_9BACT|nr:MAG: hypothetical protein COW64_13635 [bacterium (Candidatus Blackallbacteria) CG18_big_fil_WC_8_21_14_2_50_49_26]PIW14328.1 MAG: hypothetical protein COW36_22205 [bacterium (Candidatus Blackallbacteria) CG17_big_fil_post_rev_8_21_14_2_50_48_46]PIW45597.1 MAG: hypothetical protein COW20_19810 [bacterium (Candidatus Blackallbacteria) CG13_big_fil_rev_8_21_14_2_50_49_14]
MTAIQKTPVLTPQVQVPAAPAPAVVSPAVKAEAPPALAQDSVNVSNTSRTPLQRHVDFFDRNHDRTITLSETYSGLRALGVGRVTSALGAAFINGGLGFRTGETALSLKVNTDKIAAAKHDSDSDVYDQKGEFNAAKFDELFAKYDLNQDGALSREEFQNFRARNKESTAGGIASKGEFDLLVKIAAEPQKVNGKETHVISKERMQSFYDGRLFYDLAGEKAPF